MTGHDQFRRNNDLISVKRLTAFVAIGLATGLGAGLLVAFGTG
jgi:hypothetical protein